MKQPNYELLKDAYAILGGIPEDQINMNMIVSRQSGKHNCGSIACGIGWLAMHPAFNEMGLSYERPRGLTYTTNGKAETIHYAQAASNIFGITYEEARNIFEPAGDAWFVNHKHILLNRIMTLLDSKRQVKNPVYLKEKIRGG